ncbi:hypothetical protein CGRA01v4_08389 [Colletotrichum graminicola]|nr:hypothetical protein CGRA01v4_08389 [Colletotrichum graminicola]
MTDHDGLWDMRLTDGGCLLSGKLPLFPLTLYTTDWRSIPRNMFVQHG